MANNLFLEHLDTLELLNGSDFESLIEQFQPRIKNAILCVRDGTELLVFSSATDFPRDLEYEGRISNKFFYRSRKTQSLYTIFGDEAAYVFNRYLFATPPELIVAKVSYSKTQKTEVARVKYPQRAKTIPTLISC